MKCSDFCPYYWKDLVDEFPCCHFEPRAPGEVAPCEYVDDEPDDIDSDVGFDPYAGCFTDDC